MADPRFYDNRGPFTLAELCAKLGSPIPDGADSHHAIGDIASLEAAAPSHLTFCAGTKPALMALAVSKAGFCIVETGVDAAAAPPGTVLLRAAAVDAAFIAAIHLFYPGPELGEWVQQTSVDTAASVAPGVTLAPGVVIGPGAEIGEGTRIGPNTSIGRGVAVGRDCEIGADVSISHAYVGDSVVIQPGARIGQPGYGFASSARGHQKIPQLGRVIVQDRVEIGANSAVDRGALGDTVIGEGTKIDNLVHIAHNVRIGRHCLITGQVGIAGSSELGDFVVVGGQAGIADHVRLGNGTRLAARSGVPPGDYPGGKDYGGYPIRPMSEYRREVAALALLARRRKRDKNG